MPSRMRGGNSSLPFRSRRYFSAVYQHSLQRRQSMGDHPTLCVYILRKEWKPELFGNVSGELNFPHSQLYAVKDGNEKPTLDATRRYVRVGILYECRKFPPKTRVSSGVYFEYNWN